MISDFGLPIADWMVALVLCLIALLPGCLAACLLFADRRDLSCPCGHEQARDVIVHDDAHARQLTQSLTSLCWRCRAAPMVPLLSEQCAAPKEVS